MAARLRSHFLPTARRLPPGSTIASFVPLRTEVPVEELNELLRVLGHRVLLPVLLPDRDLDWSAGGDQLGVDAVAEVDLVLLPALAVDGHGMRLGQGGGSYDRALARVPEPVPLVACVHEAEILPSVPTEEHDRPVDAALTPQGLRVLRARPPTSVLRD